MTSERYTYIQGYLDGAQTVLLVYCLIRLVWG
jgi:hypothetical protein